MNIHLEKNRKFLVLGMFGISEEAISIISKFEPSKNWPCFICFRKNLFDKPDNFGLVVKIVLILNINLIYHLKMSKRLSGKINCTSLITSQN
jgi:hypothetical protein